jgi:hypothetical protein
MSFLLSLIFSLQQNQRTRERGRGQTTYTHVSKCKNDKIKLKKKENKRLHVFSQMWNKAPIQIEAIL